MHGSGPAVDDEPKQLVSVGQSAAPAGQQTWALGAVAQQVWALEAVGQAAGAWQEQPPAVQLLPWPRGLGPVDAAAAEQAAAAAAPPAAAAAAERPALGSLPAPASQPESGDCAGHPSQYDAKS